jgi:LuxR family maltose regulon positive regulatory protein
MQSKIARPIAAANHEFPDKRVVPFANQLVLDLRDDTNIDDWVENNIARAWSEAEAQNLLEQAGSEHAGEPRAQAQLAYWKGRLLTWRDPVYARISLSHAAYLHAGNDSSALRTLCAKAELELYEWGDPAALVETASQLDSICAAGFPATCGTPDVLLALACTAGAKAVARAEDAAIFALVQRTYHLMGEVTDMDTRMRAAAKLLTCTPWLPEGAPLGLARQYEASCDAEEISIFARIECGLAIAVWQLEWGGDLDVAQRRIDAVARLAEDRSLGRAHCLCGLLRVRLLIATGDNEAAFAVMRNLAAEPLLGDAAGRAQLDLLKCRLYAAVGDMACVNASARELCRSRNALGARRVERCRFAQLLAAAYAAAGHSSSAAQWAMDARSWACAGEITQVLTLSAVIDATLRVAAGEDLTGNCALAAAVSAHRNQFLPALFVGAPRFAGRAAELCFEAGADTAYMMEIVRAQRLRPESRTCPQWPWPVKIRVLGSASIEIDGKPVSITGRAQRILELLRILAAAGPGGRSQQSLERHLWAESDGPKAALAVSLHRLRKLLGSEQAVVANAGVLSLARGHVWTDVEAVYELCGQIECLQPGLPRCVIQRYAMRLLAVYAGALDQDGDDPWLTSYGARLRAHFVSAAESLGRRLEDHGAPEVAARLYRRMLDAEPFCETAYRGLMRTAHAQGDSAAAFAHYRFCRDTLSVALNRKPSEETRQLAQALGLFEQIARAPSGLSAHVNSITTKEDRVAQL